jgi:hypothetical protein
MNLLISKIATFPSKMLVLHDLGGADKVSAHFITQSRDGRVSAGFFADGVNSCHVSNLPERTKCPPKPGQTVRGAGPDTLSLFRECPVRPVRRENRKKKKHPAASERRTARRAGLAGTAAEMELHA